MSETATPGTPAGDAEPTGAAQTTDAGTETPGDTPAAATPQAGKQPDIYDKAADEFLGPNAKDPSEAPSSEHLPSPSTPSESKSPAETSESAESPQLSDDQVQLLKRQHIEPEMVKGWTENQRAEFFKNAAKRESDQTSSYKQLSEKLEELTKRVETGSDGEAEGKTGQADDGQKATPKAGFVEEAQRVADQLVDVYGTEIGDAGKLMVTMGQRLDDALAKLETTGGRVDQTERGHQISSEVVVELMLDNGISGLVSEYPSLAKDAVRKQVVDKFTKSWKAEGSPHRTAEGPMLPRIRAALADAAKLELGTKSESAAQVALANTNKERLRNQPTAGHARGKAATLTQDEIYDQAVKELIKSG